MFFTKVFTLFSAVFFLFASLHAGQHSVESISFAKKPLKQSIQVSIEENCSICTFFFSSPSHAPAPFFTSIDVIVDVSFFNIFSFNTTIEKRFHTHANTRAPPIAVTFSA